MAESLDAPSSSAGQPTPSAAVDSADVSTDGAASGELCTFFRKPPKNRTNVRKRLTTVGGDEDDDSESTTAAVRGTKKPSTLQAKGLTFSTTSSSAPADSPGGFHYSSSKTIQDTRDIRATAILETETATDRDARAIRERQLALAAAELQKPNLGKDAKAETKEELYKGMYAYKDHRSGFRREQTVSAEKAGGAHGPLRASAHIRLSQRFDYQPDICKDYKETGYCGYGDSCKFMHDRGDYKSGWQLEKEWEEQEKERKRKLAMRGGEDGSDGEDDDEDGGNNLPFACGICRNPFKDPVVTKCKHYFCEHCALKHHANNKKCFLCNQPTLGLFNTAHEIRNKAAKRK